jgi:hypothetical protein
VKRDWAVRECWPKSYPDQDKTARHESIPRLRSSAFVHNEYFGKIRCEFRSERRQKDKDGIKFHVSLFPSGSGQELWSVFINSDTREDTLSNHQRRPTQYAQDNVQAAKIVKYAFVFVLRCLAQTLYSLWEETGVPGENPRLSTERWLTLFTVWIS